MTAQERVAALHLRMAALRQRRERRKTAALGAGCASLAVCLAALIFGGSHRGGVAGAYTGAAMLLENAGGYVLSAVLAFMLGVIVTVLCVRYKSKHESGRKTKGKRGIHSEMNPLTDISQYHNGDHVSGQTRSKKSATVTISTS